MSDFLYYCGKCNSLVADTYEDDDIACDKCGARMTPLHIDEDEWNDMTTEEKQALLSRYRAPQVQRSRPNSSGNYGGSGGQRAKRVNSSQQQYRGNQYSGGKDYYDRFSGMSIAAFILSLLGCLSIIGLILGIIDLTKNDGRKRGLSIAAVVIGAIMLIASIGVGASKAGDKKEITADNSTQITADSSDAGRNSDVTVEGSANITDKTKNEITADASAEGPAASIDEQVLVEEDGVKITAVEYVQGGLFGDGIKVLIENNTSKNLTVGCDALIVNDYMITDLFVKEVAAGKQAYETIDLYTSELRKAGIDNVGKIEAYFRVYDSETWEDLFKTQCITIKTSNYDSVDTTTNIEGQELVNQDGIRIVGQYVDEDSLWGAAVLLYIENNSDKNVSISADNMSVTGLMVTPYFSSTVYAGKKAFDDITLMSSQLKESGITSIDDIELTFKAYNPDTYDDIFETGPIKFSTKK